MLLYDSLQLDSEAAWRQSHLVQVMELPSTSDQDRPWTHISGDQPDIKMLTELQVIINVNIDQFVLIKFLIKKLLCQHQLIHKSMNLIL